jgi:hypothetical protein
MRNERMVDDLLKTIEDNEVSDWGRNIILVGEEHFSGELNRDKDCSLDVLMAHCRLITMSEPAPQTNGNS